MKYLLFIMTLAILSTPLTPVNASSSEAASYLSPESPTFDLTISQFRNNFNRENPALVLSDFKSIHSNKSNDVLHLIRAATIINDDIYASAALERGSLKIKSIQLTVLKNSLAEEKKTQKIADDYMAAFIRCITPALSKSESLGKLHSLFTDSKNKRYFSQNDGAIRYVVVNNDEKGLTFAIEPIKLTLSETLVHTE